MTVTFAAARNAVKDGRWPPYNSPADWTAQAYDACIAERDRCIIAARQMQNRHSRDLMRAAGRDAHEIAMKLKADLA